MPPRRSQSWPIRIGKPGYRVGTLLVALCAGCVSRGPLEHFELHAPSSFRESGEPFEIGEWDPWSISRATGCIRPGEVVTVQARRVGPSLAVRLPKSTVFVPAREPGSMPVAFHTRVDVSGDGSPESPYVVRFRELARWLAFVDAWEAFPRDSSTAQRDLFSMELDAESLRRVESSRALSELFQASPALRDSYYRWLDEFNGAARLKGGCD